MSRLLTGLDYAQVAPAGFLLIEKAVVTLFGTSEFALRAFPLACGLIALPLFWRLAERILTGWAVPFAVGLFSLGMPFVYFSAQVKQYSSDVAASMLVLLLAIDLRTNGFTRTRVWATGSPAPCSSGSRSPRCSCLRRPVRRW